MKNFYITFPIIFIIVLLLTLFAKSFKRIEAGYTGIKVNLYGSERGISDITEVTGMVFYNPITTEIYEIPNFVQNAVYTREINKNSKQDEEFRVTTKDGLVVAFDISINYYTPAENVVKIFKKYRKPFEELSKTVVYNYLREAFNSTASNYTAAELYEKRTEFQKESEGKIRSLLEKDGFIIDQVVLLNELRLPRSVVENIELKVSASQMALRKQEELAQSIADAQKKIEESRGIAEALKIQADAENYAFSQRQRALTPLLIQQQMIEKWDGKLPVYGEVPKLFYNIQNKN